MRTAEIRFSSPGSGRPLYYGSRCSAVWDTLRPPPAVLLSISLRDNNDKIAPVFRAFHFGTVPMASARQVNSPDKVADTKRKHVTPVGWNYLNER